MSQQHPESELPNGHGAAAILAAGIGCLLLGLLALAGDASSAVNRLLVLWPPTGALSGVTSTAIVLWLLCWYGLARRWGRRNVAIGAISACAFAMLIGGLLLTFPPVRDLLQGR